MGLESSDRGVIDIRDRGGIDISDRGMAQIGNYCYKLLGRVFI